MMMGWWDGGGAQQLGENKEKQNGRSWSGETREEAEVEWET